MIRIEVTQEDIVNGVREDGQNCPIALACRRAGLLYVTVDSQIEFDNEQGFSGWLRDERIEPFVKAFDAGEKVSPMVLELEPSYWCSDCGRNVDSIDADGRCVACVAEDAKEAAHADAE